MKTCVLLLSLFLVGYAQAQIIVTNDANRASKLEQGLFVPSSPGKVIDVPKPSSEIISRLIEEDSLGLSTKGYRFAEPIAVNLDLLESANWTVRGDSTYGKVSISSKGATSISLNFSSFFLPESSEMYIYSPKGAVAGPINSNENNENSLWGSPVFRGDFLTIEIKIPLKQKPQLKLIVSNVAYGYRKVDSAKIFGFGNSGNCLVNNNVVRPLGNGWQNLRNSVCLILTGNGSILCSGAMINNSCNDNVPYLLSANHCFDQNP